MLLEIDLQGARQVRELRPDATLILLRPPSPEAQEARLRARGDDECHIAERLRAGAEEEREGRAIADEVVVNHDVTQATARSGRYSGALPFGALVRAAGGPEERMARLMRSSTLAPRTDPHPTTDPEGS